MLTELQIETIVAETCGTYRTGDSYTFEDVWNCIEKALDAHNAGAQGEVAWRYKRPNTYYDEWHYIDAGKSADELRLGIPELAFSPDSDRKDWMPLYAHPQPAADAARDTARLNALEADVEVCRHVNPDYWTARRVGHPWGKTKHDDLRSAIDAEIERLDWARGE